MRAEFLADVLRAAGLEVTEQPGWRTRGAELAAIEVMLWHHDAMPRSTSDITSLGALMNGRQKPTVVPGPLSQLGIGRSGRWYVVASGKANHAGAGRWGSCHASNRTIGVEAANDGIGEPWPGAQLASYIRGTAAILRHLGLPAEAVAAHREWATPKGRKIDPTGIDMEAVRQQLRVLLGAPPANPSEEDHMDAAQSAEAISLLRALTAEVLGREDNGNLWKLTRNMHFQLVTPGAGLQAVLAKVSADDAEVVVLDPKAVAAAIVAEMPRTDAQAIVDALVERLAE